MSTDRIPLEEAAADFYNDSSAHAGKWWMLKLLATGTFTSLTINTFNAVPTSVSLPSGTELIGDITRFQMSSNVPVIVYGWKKRTGQSVEDGVTTKEYVNVVRV